MGKYDTIEIKDRVKNGMMLEVEINFSLSEIESIIENLKTEIKRDSARFEILKSDCYKLVSRPLLPVQILEQTFFIRARTNFNGELFKNISEISYNPFVEKIELGRFNLKGEPVFYGAFPFKSANSSGLSTAICESRKDLFDEKSLTKRHYSTIGKWKIIKPIPVVLLTFYDIAADNSPFIKQINPRYIEFTSKSCVEEDDQKCKLFRNFFSEHASKRFDTENSYLLTTAFYHAVKEFYGNEVGILYSSSMTENYGINVVLSKDIIDKNYLELEHVVMYNDVRNPSNPKLFNGYQCSDTVKPNKEGRFNLLHII